MAKDGKRKPEPGEDERCCLAEMVGIVLVTVDASNHAVNDDTLKAHSEARVSYFGSKIVSIDTWEKFKEFVEEVLESQLKRLKKGE